jgi:DNA-binding XRE family transcriptional regulator
MDMDRRIIAAAAYAGMNQSDLAQAIGMTKQGFHSKIKRRTFSEEELARIAEAIGATVDFRFEFPDGTRI